MWVCLLFVVFFFFKQKTSYELRISDWSSDVCSSDLTKDVERYHIELEGDGTYRAFEDVEFNLGSPKQRVDKLQQLGWIPREFTEKGFPRPFDKGKLSPYLEEFLEENPKAEVELKIGRAHV